MRTILKTPAASVMLLGVLVSPGLAACSASGGSTSNRMQVVAAENFWGSIAQQIAGPDADVTSIVSNPNADPHAYEPTPQDARAVATAQLVIENGIGYDPWAQRLLDADRVPGRTVLDVGKLVGVPDGGNPHQWYSRASVEKFVHRVVVDLATADPQHRSGYERRGKDFEASSLAQYNTLIDQIKQRYAGTPIGASENIVTLWTDTLGLKMMTPASFLDAISEGSEPTASAKAAVDAQIKHHDIKVFVFNSQNSTPDVQRLVDSARQASIPITTVTETLTPANATFQSWQASELRDLLRALAKGSSR